MSYSDQIENIKKKMGDQLCIMGHHYQAQEVIDHADLTGDSLELARKVSGLTCEYIVFCGVHFMAETASVTKSPGQKVLIPDVTASCVMADTAPAAVVARVMEGLTKSGRKVIPLAYVNSSASVKAVCGRYGGSVCTSANADVMMKWAMSQGDAVLFLPDKNLGANTAEKMGVDKDKIAILDVRGGGGKADGYKDSDISIFLWPGVCAIHHKFKLSEMKRIRAEEPDAKIVVHPECPPELVQESDGAGSTSFLIKYCDEADPGTKIYVGTETNLVRRLAERYQGQKEILPLGISFCSNMCKITEQKLAEQLSDLASQVPVEIPEDIAAPARAAIETMLRVCS